MPTLSPSIIDGSGWLAGGRPEIRNSLSLRRETAPSPSFGTTACRALPSGLGIPNLYVMNLSGRNRESAFAVILAMSFTVGLWLRLYLLTDQIVIDDEWHGLHYVIGKSPLWLLTHFSIPGATCIPLNFYTWVLGSTVGWSETMLRLPSLLGGLLCLIVGPWLARDLIGRRRAALLALLLAVSPMLIFYSRIIRPYSSVALLSFATLLLAARWRQSGRRQHALLFVMAGTLAVYFHLFAIIAVAAPFLATLAAHLHARWRKLPDVAAAGPPLKHWLLAAAAMAGLTAILVLPALIASLRSTFFKVALTGTLHWDTLPEVARLFAGTGQPLLALLFWIAVVAGAVQLCRRQLWFGALLVSLYPLHVGALILSRPDSAQSAIVLARYCMPLVCVTLLLAACGAFAALDAISRRLAWHPVFPFALAAGGVVCLALAGPLPQCYAAPNNFTSHGVYQHRYGPIDWRLSFYSDLTPPGFTLITTIRADEVSPFYRQLSERPGSAPIVEYPMPIGDHFNPLYYYQHVHRRPVQVGYTVAVTNSVVLPEGNIFGDTYIDQILSRATAPGQLRFRHLVAMEDLATMRARGVEFIIIHKRFEAQLGVMAPPTDLDRLGRLYRGKLGAPVYQDAFIAVFGL